MTRRWWIMAMIFVTLPPPSWAERSQRSLADYRYFRALAIDFLGRPPTRAEIAELERPQFQFEDWLDAHLAGKRYAERIRTIYSDLLRLDLPLGAALFKPPPVMLRWTTIMGPDGKVVDLYFRDGQRRKNPDIDGQVCFSSLETGLTVPPDGPAVGTAKRISRELLEARTQVVKPWWLYADYASPNPHDRAGPDWVKRYGFELTWSMFTEPDGKTPMTGVRVCREEAQTAETGHVFATGRVVSKADPILPGRQTRLPADSAFAKAHKDEVVSCQSKVGFESTVECGCGVGLERCAPTGPNGFVMPWSIPLGVEQPFDAAPRPAILWLRTWWAEEAKHFLDNVFEQDRDVRGLLTSRGTTINGPLAQFYRYFANTTCCGDGPQVGYFTPEGLFDPTKVPISLAPYVVDNWTDVSDRGPNAAGIMTMPVFLLKYGSRRQRAHAIYSAFTCRDFVAETAQLEPSNEPDLTKRPGCSACHERLEPMAAYFSRIQESDWTFLPPAKFPVEQPRCTTRSSPFAACKSIYDPAFTTPERAVLRGAYANTAHADLGPQGFASEVTSSKDFAPCVVRNIATSLLGRTLTVDDNGWKMDLAEKFVDGGYRMRGLVHAVATSDRYRNAAVRGHSARGSTATTTSPARLGAASATAGPVPQPRMVPPEAFLRAYLSWFGDLTPSAAFTRARGDDLFDRWPDYLAALGLPDDHTDSPRITRSNTVMLAVIGRLGEALCVRSAQHDLHGHPAADKRTLFAFDLIAKPTLAQFEAMFDVLHRTFLSYPVAFAPRARVQRFYELYQRIAANGSPRAGLSADETAWIGICTALVQHPEANVY